MQNSCANYFRCKVDHLNNGYDQKDLIPFAVRQPGATIYHIIDGMNNSIYSKA